MRTPGIAAIVMWVALCACSAEAPASADGGWIEPGEYVFSVEAGCGRRLFSGRFRVHVADGEVAEYVALDPRRPRVQLPPNSVPTLGDLVDRFREARADRDATVRLVTDPTDGHPVSLEIDWLVDIIDDEECYEVFDYAPGSP
ncbi:MAG: DUF6174 domain-containing protein [Candidatus Limnocylindria bacterium]